MATVMLMLSLSAVAGERGYIRREGSSQWVEEISGSAAAAAAVVIAFPEGDVVVSGGDQQKITWRLTKRVRTRSELEARHEFQRLRFGARKTQDVSYLEGQYDASAFQKRAELAVTVPRSVKSVKLTSSSGTLRVQEIHGRAEVRLGAGSLHLDRIGGSAFAKVGMGSVDIGSIGGDLTLRTHGARVRVNSVRGRISATSDGGNITINSATQGITAKTSSGDIQIGRCDGELVLNTGGGSLELGQVGGRAALQTAAGNIRLSSAGGLVTASTGGGKINLWGLAQGAEARISGGGPITAELLEGSYNGSTLQTPSGDIIVYVSPRLRATIKASIDMANGHKLVSQFSEIRVTEEGTPYGGNRTLYGEGQLNGGGPVLRIRTSNGNIELRRARK